MGLIFREDTLWIKTFKDYKFKKNGMFVARVPELQ